MTTDSTPMNWPKEIIIYTDGASRGNPGPASVGIVFTDLKGNIIETISEYLGEQTNNFAEYSAVVKALSFAQAQGVNKIELRSDSELMIRQMTGLYKVKSESIRPLFEQCQTLAKFFRTIKFNHVRREFNKEADRLANLALDHR